MAYNKIKLGDGQICDYIYIQDKAFAEKDFTHINDEPSAWTTDTVLYANFSDPESPLKAGDSAALGSIVGHEVYRKKYNEAHVEYVGTVQKSENSKNDILVDYSVKNGVSYSYYLYPSSDTTEAGAPLSPLVTQPVATNCLFWSLLIVDETDQENLFYLDKMFKFEFNLQINEMSNNAEISVTPTFTKYPNVRFGSSNYWSGSLSSLCGILSCDNADYIQTVNMIDELKAISSDTRRKFLKDTDGNLWEVSLSAPISISTDNDVVAKIKTLSLSWVEVGDAKNVVITNNPNKSVTEWILTETGKVIPYYTYTWGDQYVWDDSYIWTEQISNYNVRTNLGKIVNKQGGDL